MQHLEPHEELAFLQEIYGADHRDKILHVMVEAYNVLQARAQTLLGLVTIILTIAGFSGPTIAASSPSAQLCVGVGLSLVLLSAIVTMWGPLQLRWATQWRESTVDESLVALIARRNVRTRKYHAANVLLVAGMACYVGGMINYVFKL